MLSREVLFCVLGRGYCLKAGAFLYASRDNRGMDKAPQKIIRFLQPGRQMWPHTDNLCCREEQNRNGHVDNPCSRTESKSERNRDRYNAAASRIRDNPLKSAGRLSAFVLQSRHAILTLARWP
jgi:hypothetical protein